MHNIKLFINNKKKVFLLISGILILFISVVLLPFWFINYFPLSRFGHFLSENIIYSVITLLIFLFFVLKSVYYYNITIDNYIVKVISYRPFISFLKEKDYVDIPHNMLNDFSLSYSFFSFNSSLKLKIDTISGKKIKKKFNLSMVSHKELKKINSALEFIITMKK